MEWLNTITEFFASLEAAVVSLGDSPWLVLVVFAFCCIDAVFPIVPSDSMVTAGTVLALANGAAPIFIVVLVVAAAVGAFIGDCLAYFVGSKIPLHRIPMLRGAKGQAALRYTRHAFARRGSTLVLTGRFIPVGRIAVNMSAGATGFPFHRFLPVIALAGVLWAGVAAGMGIVANHVFDDQPLLAMVVGVMVGICCGLLTDWIMQRRRKRKIAKSNVRQENARGDGPENTP